MTAAVLAMVTSMAPAHGEARTLSRTADRLPAGSYYLPRTSTQLIVGVAEDWNSNRVVLQRFERRPGGKWQRVGGHVAGRLGARGLAWGRGLHPLDPSPPGAPVKREGDDRSPAGVFTLGPAFGYAPDVERKAAQEYIQVTPYDLLVDDPASSSYNAHLRLDHLPATPWERSQQMEQKNPAHALQVMINHNMEPRVVPGAGSLILFHIWRREGASNTAGCTSMSEQDIRSLVAWIDPTRRPVYALLPQPLYDSLASPWGLPASMKGVAVAPAGSTTTATPPTTATTVEPVPVGAKPVTRLKRR